MAGPSKKTAKSESLTIRLDPKTRFMLEFVSRLRGQTITTVVERAISEAASRATIDDPDNYGEPLTWRDFWSVYEGERALKIADQPLLHPTYDEERRLAFTRRFWPFFYHDRKAKIVRDDFLDVLWPHIDYLIGAHDEMKQENINAGPEIMASLLEDAKLVAPRWPPASEFGLSRNMDDDIPF